MKRELIENMLAHLASELESLRSSTAVVAQSATHEENRPENKYDTRGLEASYLAGAQSARMRELASTISQLEAMELRSFKPGDPIGPSALIEVEHQGKLTIYFLVTVGAGIRMQVDGREIVSLTVSSPLGSRLLSKIESDIVSLKTSHGVKDYEIVSVR